MNLKGKTALLLSTLLALSGCSTSTTSTSSTTAQTDADVDFTMFLNLNAHTSTFMTDLNQHIGALAVETATGSTVDYISGVLGEEHTSFLFLTVRKDLPDLFKISLETHYKGGVASAIKDGMILDATTLIEENAPHFIEQLQQVDGYAQSAYSDQGVLSQFGVTIVAEELRGVPMYGPMINLTYLEQTGLEPPVTLADWEEMLQAFQDLGIKSPLSFGATDGFSSLYDAFASAFGVTVGANYYQEDGVVKFSPLEDGYYDFLELMSRWYENGWIDAYFYDKTQEDVLQEFEQGTVGATIAHCSTSAKEGGNFLPVPYPIAQEGDVIATRHYTPDFYGDPIFIHSVAQDPETMIQWVDFFYSEEGQTLSNWGQEDLTYYVSEDGSYGFTDFVLNDPDFSIISMLAGNVFQEMTLLQDIDYQMQFYPDQRQHDCWEVWSQASFDHALPPTMTLSEEEQNYIQLDLDELPLYVEEMTLKYIMGQESLERYSKFIENIQKMQGETFTQFYQNALERYHARGPLKTP